MSAVVPTTQRKLKYVATINDETLGEDTDAQFEIQYVDIGNVDSSGSIRDIVTYEFEQAPSRARRRIRDGDVIISTVRTYLQAIASVQNPPENMIASTGFAVVRPGPEFDANYCKYALREPGFLAEVERHSVGVSYPAIGVSDLASIPVHVLPFAKQRTIAEYLDRETGQLDRLMAAEEWLLELLAEKRHALITRAVTRGLDPSVPLCDSDISWIGEIPAHWRTKRARWLFSERRQHSESGEEELLTVSHLTGVTPRSEKDVYMFEAKTRKGYKICLEGDLVINTLWAWMGAMGISPVDGIVSPAYHVYEPIGQLERGYVEALVRLPVFSQEVVRYSKGVWSSRLRLYPEGLFEVSLPVPPLSEQREIISSIRDQIKELDVLEVAAKHTISLLKERRSALISAAVTGQIQVESAA